MVILPIAIVLKNWFFQKADSQPQSVEAAAN